MSAKAGEIYFCPLFPFKNGEVGAKFLVLLNTPQKNEPFIFCKTTSQQKYKQLTEYCQPDYNLFLLLANKDFFTKNTWLQFYELYEFTNSEFLDLHTNNKLEFKGKLKDLTMRQIINCIKKCKRDIRKSYLTLILKRIGNE